MIIPHWLAEEGFRKSFLLHFISIRANSPTLHYRLVVVVVEFDRRSFISNSRALAIKHEEVLLVCTDLTDSIGWYIAMSFPEASKHLKKVKNKFEITCTSLLLSPLPLPLSLSNCVS